MLPNQMFSSIFQCHWLLSILFLLAILGCQQETSVKGTVTYNGEPLSRGILSVTPADGRGRGEGAKVVDGAYEIKSLEPGKKKFSVRGEIGGFDGAAAPYTSENKLESLAAAEKVPIKQIPPNAVGNGQVSEIVHGSQTVDLELSDPQ